MDINQHDANWSGDLGATIVNDSPVDANCAPACEPGCHIC